MYRPTRRSVCCRKTSVVRARYQRPDGAILRLLFGEVGIRLTAFERYNGLPSMEILGQAAPGKSTGEAMNLMEQLASKRKWHRLRLDRYVLSGTFVGQPGGRRCTPSRFWWCSYVWQRWCMKAGPVPFSVMLVLPLGLSVGGCWPRRCTHESLRVLPGRAADHHRSNRRRTPSRSLSSAKDPDGERRQV